MEKISKNTFWLALLILTFYGCNSSGEKKTSGTNGQSQNGTDSVAKKDPQTPGASATGGEVKDVAILCYHQIRDWTPKDSKSAKDYIIPIAAFKDQIKTLHDSGYHAILPDQLIAHMVKGDPLPSKPVMLTFDDGPESQIENGLPELDKAGFKAVYFIMTVVLGHPRYFTKEQVKMLFDKGNVIGSHTWNHTMVTKVKTDEDIQKQLVKPRADLEKLTGQPIKYFAYPFGVWNQETADYLKKEGFTAAFQLWGKNGTDKFFTIRRIIANPNWTGKQLLNNIRRFQQ